MATWMIHLRIADMLLDQIPGLSAVEFVMGNIAPDSGVPDESWAAFTPSKTVSHFKVDDGTGKMKIAPDAFCRRYFSPALRQGYDEKHFSFYLGYLVHLLTDVLWTERVLGPSREKFAEQREKDKALWIHLMKKDWYDLDFKYLRDHPSFRAFRVYQGAVGFVNTYMEEFWPDAFDNRRAYITGFYLQSRDGLDRKYLYLTEAEADRFVEESAVTILNELREVL